MKSLLPHRLGFGCLAALALASCSTTGDPTQGGLFGWSENQARQRIDDRRYTLSQIEADTAAQRRRTSSLEAERNRLQKKTY